MENKDADRWNSRYLKNERFANYTQPRPFLLQNAGYLPTAGLALDLAMGLGGNSAFLLARGLQVLGVDISSVAVHKAKQRLPALMAVIADLTRFYLPPQSFDVILNFYYLQRDLWPQYLTALRPGGVLFFQTLTQEMLRFQPDTDPVYLLMPGELLQAFADWEVITYREGWEESRSGSPHAVASLVAKKKPS